MLAASVKQDLEHLTSASQHCSVAVEFLVVHHDDHITQRPCQAHLVGLQQKRCGVVGVLQLDHTHFSQIHSVDVCWTNSLGCRFLCCVPSYLCKQDKPVQKERRQKKVLNTCVTAPS